MPRFLAEEFVRQRLSDRDTVDYFPAAGELEAICWRWVMRRDSQVTLVLSAMEVRLTPLAIVGSSHFWQYCISQYQGGIAQWPLLQGCAFDNTIHQPAHKYALFQSNCFIDGVHNYGALIDEINLSAEFTTDQSGTITLKGYPLNISRLMHDVFHAIADDVDKLAIYQSTMGGATDLREAGKRARAAGAAWLKGSYIPQQKLMGSRRWM